MRICRHRYSAALRTRTIRNDLRDHEVSVSCRFVQRGDSIGINGISIRTSVQQQLPTRPRYGCISHDRERTFTILKCPANEARCKGVHPKSVEGSTSTSSSSRICRTTAAVETTKRERGHLCDLCVSIARRHVQRRPVSVCHGSDIGAKINQQLRKGPQCRRTRRHESIERAEHEPARCRLCRNRRRSATPSTGRNLPRQCPLRFQ